MKGRKPKWSLRGSSHSGGGGGEVSARLEIKSTALRIPLFNGAFGLGKKKKLILAADLSKPGRADVQQSASLLITF